MTVDEHTVDLASGTAFYRSAPAQLTPTPVFIHGVPTNADIWESLLARTGGVALDLPGFGRSDKGGHLDYSVAGLAQSATDLIARLQLGPVSVVGQGWGALVAAAIPAERHVLINPIAPDAPWPRAARLCRARGLGELAMGALTRGGLGRLLRRGGAWSDAEVAALWDQFDQGTQRAILRLHRTELPVPQAPATPTLILHGDEDPWLGPEHAQAVARRRPGARVETIDGAGHWPWRGRDDVVETIAAFLAQP